MKAPLRDVYHLTQQQTWGARSGERGASEPSLDAYGREMSTRGTARGTIEYDERWYGVRRHIHDGVIVEPREL